MVDLDSDPTKLIEVVGLGKQLLMTRGALTTFSVANDVAKYFAIIPAIFVILYPSLGVLNVMGLESSQSAILSAIIFNALIIPMLVPLALKGVKYRPAPAGRDARAATSPFTASAASSRRSSASSSSTSPSPASASLKERHMGNDIKTALRPAISFLVLLTLITGLIYPMVDHSASPS